jgi:lipopolysaccharide transport system permease protein
LAELWRYRELFYFLAWRDVKIRYKQATLGAAWAVLQPLVAMLIFSVVFRNLSGRGDEATPYALSVYCALVPWIYFSSTLSLAGNSLISNSNLITKIYFPRVLLPASSALGGLLDFAVGSLFLLVLMFYYGVQPTPWLLLYPVVMLGLWFLTLGISLLLAAMNVKYRDVKHAIPFVVQLWLFVTPVIYPPSFVPEQYRPLLALNPLTGFMEAFRACVFPDRPVSSDLIVSSLVATVLMLVVGLTYFQRSERRFADVV